MAAHRIRRAALLVLHGTGITLFVGMCGLVLAQVVARKFFEPLVWSEELARYTFIWVCYLGWVIANSKRSHIRISLVTDRAGRRLKAALVAFAELLLLALALIFLINGWRLVRNNLDIETITLFFDFWVVYLIIPLSALASIAIAIGDLVALWRGESESREIVL